MNYKILAASAVLTGALAYALLTSQSYVSNKYAGERITAVDVDAPETQFGFSEALSPSPWPPPPPPASSRPAMELPAQAEAMSDFSSLANEAIALGAPKIAYRFGYGFRVPSAAIKPLQEHHADMCEKLGPTRCRILSMEQAEDEGDYGYGSLALAVASDEARAFGKKLVGASGEVDGELVTSSIDGEDLSKSIVDTEARLRARTVLRDRLLEVLRSRSGTVKELVEAERGVAQVNEEIDQATSWLAEMKARVAFSRMDVQYQSGTPAGGGFLDPLRGAIGSLGWILGVTLAGLLIIGTVALPVLAIVLGIRWARRRYGRSEVSPVLA